MHRTPTVADIIGAVEAFAPPTLQESWDNSGLQVGHRDTPVTGVLTCLDLTPERVAEAIDLGANMIVSHHPLLFRGVKAITADTRNQRAIEDAILARIAVYSCHTSIDSARGGVSHLAARAISLHVDSVLAPSASNPSVGLGVVGHLDKPLSPTDLAQHVRQYLHVPVVRCSNPELGPRQISRVAVCGGAGGEFITRAIEAGAQAYITADVRYHDFIDNADRIFLMDCGHYETEAMTRALLAAIIADSFPGLPVTASPSESNPVTYIY